MGVVPSGADPVLVFRTSMKHYLLENKDEQSHYLHIGI